tara:strand:- start:34 stop:2115 length:2082 start_codon:yes stop_codon:yes gene_type:complete
MSSRERKKPDTFLPPNFRGNETRKKAKTPAKTPAKKRKRPPVVVKTPGTSKQKGGPNEIIFNVLNKVSEKNKTKTFNMLYSIYKDTDSPKLKKTLSSLKNITPEQFINEQYEILKDNVRSNGKKNTLNLLNLSDIDKLDFCLLIWLDMRHDAKTKTSDSMKDVSFEKFLNNKDSPLKMIIENPPAFQMTDLMNKMIVLKILKDFKNPGPQNWERRIKDNLPKLFGIKEPNIISSQKVYGFDPENPINISIDSEGKQSAISMLIAINKRKVINNSTRYPIRSIITIANRADPGNTMPTGGVQQEWTKLFDNSGNLKSTQIYNVSDCEFKIGDTKLELTSGTKGTFNMTVNGKPIKVGSTAGNVRPVNNFNLHPENRGRFPTQNIYKIQKLQKNELRVSKFLGDFMQILTVCSEPQSGKVTAFGTLDGVAAGMYTFISKRLMNREPRLFIDMYIDKGNVINVYGFSQYLNARRNANQSVIRTYNGKVINGNMRNTASSGGGGNIRAASVSNGNRTITANSGSNGNRTIRANSGNSGNSTNTNMVQPLRKKQKSQLFPNKNTLSIASAIRGTKNNNNEVTSGIAKMRNLKPKFVMGTKPKTNKKSPFPSTMYRRKVTKPQTTVLNPKRRTRNNNNNNKLTPKKPKTIARVELNKLTSLSRNQKINYLEKIKRDPTNILRILNNARRVANSQRPPRQ